MEKAAENTTVDLPNGLIEEEIDRQMDRFGYQLQMNGITMEQYAKMLGGNLESMRTTFRPVAEKQARVNVTLEKIVETEGFTVSDEEIEEEMKKLAESYDMEVEKIKEMVPTEEIKESLLTRKAAKCITESAVAVAPKASEEKTEE